MSNDDKKPKNTKGNNQSSKASIRELSTNSETVQHQKSSNVLISNVTSKPSTTNKVEPTIIQQSDTTSSNRSANNSSDVKRKLDTTESVLADLPPSSKNKKKFKINDDGGASAGGSIASSVSSNDQDDSFDGKDDKDTKKKKNRCATCRKKVGLTGFQCRCGGLYCAVHRYSDKHDCSFNYREMGAQEIRRNNPVVVGEKIQKI